MNRCIPKRAARKAALRYISSMPRAPVGPVRRKAMWLFQNNMHAMHTMRVYMVASLATDMAKTPPVVERAEAFATPLVRSSLQITPSCAAACRCTRDLHTGLCVCLRAARAQPPAASSTTTRILAFRPAWWLAGLPAPPQAPRECPLAAWLSRPSSHRGRQKSVARDSSMPLSRSCYSLCWMSCSVAACCS